MKTALVTGVKGQDGAYLARLLLKKGYRVVGTYRRSSSLGNWRLQTLGINKDIEMIEFDLTEVNGINRTIREIQPDELYNLAAQSFVASSWDNPGYTTDVDAVGVLRLLDAIRTYSAHTRFYQASSSEMFGNVGSASQSEQSPFHPRSPYAVAKAYGHFITVNYRESFGLHTTSGILFNHESPLRGPDFVTRKITMALARLARGGDEPVVLGSLDSKRDWGFAGDYVEGMWRMLQQNEAGDYVLATGRATSVREFAQHAAAALCMDIVWSGEGADEVGHDSKSGKTIVTVSAKHYRPADVEYLCGDAKNAQSKLGWRPTVGVEDLAAMMAEADYDLVGRAWPGEVYD